MCVHIIPLVRMTSVWRACAVSARSDLDANWLRTDVTTVPTEICITSSSKIEIMHDILHYVKHNMLRPITHKL